MTIEKIQEAAAKSGDELEQIVLGISELLEIYEKADWATCKMKLLVLQTMCGKLEGRLKELEQSLERAEISQKLSDERKISIALTGQLLKQNRLILTEKQSLLLRMEQHTAYIDTQQKINRTLEKEIEMQRIRRTIQAATDDGKGGGTD